MPRIARFEDIDAWKKARELTRTIYRITSKRPFSQDFCLRDQIRRASISIMSNIAEGFERKGDKEFRQFLSIAKGSAGEVQAQLYVALDAAFITQEEFDGLYGQASEVAKMLGGFIEYLNKTRDPWLATRD